MTIETVHAHVSRKSCWRLLPRLAPSLLAQLSGFDLPNFTRHHAGPGDRLAESLHCRPGAGGSEQWHLCCRMLLEGSGSLHLESGCKRAWGRFEMWKSRMTPWYPLVIKHGHWKPIEVFLAIINKLLADQWHSMALWRFSNSSLFPN